MRKPTATQIRVAQFLAEVAAECARDPLDSASAYFVRVGQEFDIAPESLEAAASADPCAISCTDARMLSRAIGPM